MSSTMIELMPLNPTWMDIAGRLLLVVAAGALIGLNREAGGHAAGFRTTILVGLAACLTMIQANLLLSTMGKTPQSFASMDILRFPLGILTGVGFIGGGAILKRGDLITGVTTAATLWIMTAIGLCIGGGQLVVGSAGAVAAFIVLSPFKWFDELISHRQKARMVIELAGSTYMEKIETEFSPLGYSFCFTDKSINEYDGTVHATFQVRWKHAGAGGGASELLTTVEERYKVVSFEMMTTTA
ncbi:MgtC/SapB family protein [Rhizobium leucaenae]|uniref:Protein MgtC n=1 Tax=Rhizobium leucaenae TaxID=29450 RepID=A0A7W6ZR79_9HYPH|nr:MgtC/SapB family protein [Rhizobium leucaenae]MBB4567249.1 putative Mg2+ transporter-C (MgtC) family protein [Rhizobium leucaenae]MBB6304271.1 putative Mg2+ transporter-C (MgtC) family protein [Rhizobium leucaenae]